MLQRFAVTITVLSVNLTAWSHAQVVHFPDPNLRAAVAESIGTDPDRITVAALQRLQRLGVHNREIESLEGLEHAPNLRLLDLWNNRISDLKPLSNLHNLEELGLGENAIKDMTPIAGLTNLLVLTIDNNLITDVAPLRGLTRLRGITLENNSITDIIPMANLLGLEYLRLGWNVIKDISPLAGLTNLRILTINHNMITDVEALSGLTELREIAMQHNFITDYSPLDSLSLDAFVYDQICDLPPKPLEPRLAHRSFPSIFASFTSEIVNKVASEGILDRMSEAAYHDIFFSSHLFWDNFRVVDEDWRLVSFGVKGDLSTSSLGDYPPVSIDRRDQYLARNPNMIFLLEVRFLNSGATSPPYDFPDDHLYWLRDANGQIVYDGERRVINYAHPDVQDIIVGQALAIAKCGLYDGVFFDHWSDFSSKVDDKLISDEVGVNARENIIRRIREGARDNFLIIGNTNDVIIPRTGPMMSGALMESIVPSPGVPREPSIRVVRKSLEWLENNLREPRLIMLQGGTDRSEPPDSPYNQRLMRATTTMSLTHSDGYTQFGIDSGDIKFWYDFWDADLGQPAGPRFQLYENIEGLYVREFDNGWAVYNQSGDAQVVVLPEEVQSAANGLVDTEHAVLNIDGDIFLKVETVKPADLNGDGIVNILDLILVAQGIGANKTDVDVNGDGVVNVFDLVFVANQF